jgi:hypothetical protein
VTITAETDAANMILLELLDSDLIGVDCDDCDDDVDVDGLDD